MFYTDIGRAAKTEGEDLTSFHSVANRTLPQWLLPPLIL